MFLLNLYNIIFSGLKEDSLGDNAISFQELRDSMSKLFLCTES